MHLQLSLTMALIASALALPTDPALSETHHHNHNHTTTDSWRPLISACINTNCSSGAEHNHPEKGTKLPAAKLSNGTCTKFTPTTANVCIGFGGGNFSANAITLYTDENCKSVGKVGDLKRMVEETPEDDIWTCVHPSDFGGETWGSVMWTA